MYSKRKINRCNMEKFCPQWRPFTHVLNTVTSLCDISLHGLFKLAFVMWSCQEGDRWEVPTAVVIHWWYMIGLIWVTAAWNYHISPVHFAFDSWIQRGKLKKNKHGMLFFPQIHGRIMSHLMAQVVQSPKTPAVTRWNFIWQFNFCFTFRREEVSEFIKVHRSSEYISNYITTSAKLMLLCYSNTRINKTDRNSFWKSVPLSAGHVSTIHTVKYLAYKLVSYALIYV